MGWWNKMAYFRKLRKRSNRSAVPSTAWGSPPTSKVRRGGGAPWPEELGPRASLRAALPAVPRRRRADSSLGWPQRETPPDGHLLHEMPPSPRCSGFAFRDNKAPWRSEPQHRGPLQKVALIQSSICKCICDWYIEQIFIRTNVHFLLLIWTRIF